jgi:hypothetical protein
MDRIHAQVQYGASPIDVVDSTSELESSARIISLMEIKPIWHWRCDTSSLFGPAAVVFLKRSHEHPTANHVVAGQHAARWRDS